jgi:hypothetical protein
MTIKELKALLAQFPDGLEVMVSIDTKGFSGHESIKGVSVDGWQDLGFILLEVVETD